eukprot:TRINITY_DN2112_c0_g1_i4.p2 TRINITY_DN2112_c0_g1~~TRINITY_DN2112_c0_g1_i4.p2  ORF type:complete len:126 (+),score=19.04 TRINITY_DN2112_c0_g1_i4:494-871(+)
MGTHDFYTKLGVSIFGKYCSNNDIIIYLSPKAYDCIFSEKEKMKLNGKSKLRNSERMERSHYSTSRISSILEKAVNQTPESFVETLVHQCILQSARRTKVLSGSQKSKFRSFMGSVGIIAFRVVS